MGMLVPSLSSNHDNYSRACYYRHHRNPSWESQGAEEARSFEVVLADFYIEGVSFTQWVTPYHVEIKVEQLWSPCLSMSLREPVPVLLPTDTVSIGLNWARGQIPWAPLIPRLPASSRTRRGLFVKDTCERMKRQATYSEKYLQNTWAIQDSDLKHAKNSFKTALWSYNSPI